MAITMREGDAAFIEQLVGFYVKSVIHADVHLAASIWLNDPKTSMIHPRGEDIGWENIRQHFYLDRLQKLYTERSFEISHLDIQTYRDAAIAMFTWQLKGKLRSDGTEVSHAGRTSHVFYKVAQEGWRRTSQGGWKIIHAHVSGMPIASERQHI